MKSHYVVRPAVLAGVLVCSWVALAAVNVEPDKDNVVGSKLEGTWEPYAALNKRLGGNDMGTITFKINDGVARTIPVKYDTFLNGKRIYLAGVMTMKNQQYPFLLIEHKGNPHVVYFRQKGEDPMGDAESFNVMLAVAKDTANDLLLIGGDFNNQPFAAYDRAAAK